MKYKLMIAAILILMLTGCNKVDKKPITEEEFKTKMEDAGYEVTNVTDLKYNPCNVLVATIDKFQMDFYYCKNEDDAKEAYKEHEGYVIETGSDVEKLKKSNYNKIYTIDESIKDIAIRLDNTMIYYYDYSDEVDYIIEYLGY